MRTVKSAVVRNGSRLSICCGLHRARPHRSPGSSARQTTYRSAFRRESASGLVRAACGGRLATLLQRYLSIGARSVRFCAQSHMAPVFLPVCALLLRLQLHCVRYRTVLCSDAGYPAPALSTLLPVGPRFRPVARQCPTGLIFLARAAGRCERASCGPRRRARAARRIRCRHCCHCHHCRRQARQGGPGYGICRSRPQSRCRSGCSWSCPARQGDRPARFCQRRCWRRPQP